MSWKGIGIKSKIQIWQLYYAIKYGIIFLTLEELDEYLEKKK